LTAAQRSDPEQQNPAIPGCSPKENPFFPVKSGKRRVLLTCNFAQFREDFHAEVAE
jgi:hypothetical protein